MHGQYEAKSVENEGFEGMSSIAITYGHSREHRPDLKQFMVDLMSTSDGDVPLYFRAADGNEADKTVFANLLRDFKEQFDVEALFVADSALFSKENVQSLRGLSWLTRVPQTLAEAKRLLSELKDADFEKSCVPGYRIAQRRISYGGILQRWLIIESDEAQTRSAKQEAKVLAKQEHSLHKSLQALFKRNFHCEADAEQAIATFGKTLKYHRLENLTISSKKHYLKRGRPTANTPFERRYYVQASLVLDEAAIEDKQTRLGRFILASNLLNSERYSNDQLLLEYKAQQSAERGFRFLREPLFFTPSVFLKTPSRVAALALIMALSLLVYTLGQRLLRQNLAAKQATIRHQTGKSTSTPTLRWVFQMFQAVHLITLGNARHISNLTKERQHILSFLSPHCRKYYLLI